MKKLTLSMLAIILAVSTILSFAACSATPEQKLQAYIESDEVQEEIKEMTASLESMLDIEVSAKGTQVVFDYTYKNAIPEESVELVVPQLETAFSSMSSAFDTITEEIKESVGIDDVSVLIVVNNADGTKLFDYEINGN